MAIPPPPPLPRDRFIVDSTSFPGLSLLLRHKGENPGHEVGSILTHFLTACVAGGIVSGSKNFGRGAAKSCGRAGIFTCLQVLWFEGNIVKDWKKAPNLAQMLFRVSKTNLEGVSNDPKIRGGGKTSISFAAPFVSLKLTFQLTFYWLTFVYVAMAWSS